jgi:hypothetical protein
MKKQFLFLLPVFLLGCTFLHAQVKISETDQKQIQSILGKDFNAVFKDGNFVIVKPESVSQIKSNPKTSGLTGFAPPSKVNPIATLVAVYKDVYFIYKAGDMISEKLGKERIEALSNILEKNNILINFR